MILLLDIGNTRVKWRLSCAVDDTAVVQGLGAFDPAESLQKSAFIAEVLALLQGDKLLGIWVAEVGDALQRFALLDAIERHFAAVPVRQIHSEANCLGVENSYQQPQRLGVDRWLSAVEAWHIAGAERPVAIFDLGTAAKLDVVAGGRHRGGHIVPGLAMMRDTLQQKTQKVRYAGEDTRQTGWGESTAAAVENGTWVMLVAWLREELSAFYKAYPQGQAYLAGGDAASVLAALGDDGARMQLQQSLVLDALWRVYCHECEQ